MDHFTHSVAVEGYEDYRVCPCGIVISLKRSVPRNLASFRRSKAGHYAVNLCQNGRMVTKALHIIVAKAFIPNPNHSVMVSVLHKDDDPSHNEASNLYWGTPAQNSKQMVLHQRQSRGSNRPLSKLNEEKVRQIRQLAATVSQKVLAERFGVSRSTLNSVVLKRTWTHVAD